MSESEILKCLIAFVLGYLIARMMRGNGLVIEDEYCDPKAIDPPQYCPNGINDSANAIT